MRERPDIVGIDAAIIMNPRVWEASGHMKSFSDPLVECKKCHQRFRVDELDKANKTKCPNCGACDFTDSKQFNLMVEVYLGVIEGEKQKAYLRGELTQGVHVNFKNVLDSTRVKIPFGVAQIGKAFRNEITPEGLTFRSREFEQMELQFYIKPDKKEVRKWFDYWQKERMNWFVSLGMKKSNLRFREHKSDELAHYASKAIDIEYKAGDEWKEMEGIHNRGDWDLKQHQEFSKEDLTYFDEETKDRFLPWIIETSGGVDRALLFFLMDAYTEEKVGAEERTVLKLHPRLAPYKVAVFPLLANKPKLVSKAKSIFDELKKNWMISWDDRGNIGKRYRAQDEAGTPWCITVDFDTLEDDTVTVRDRDTMKQERIPVKGIREYISKRLT